MTIRKPMDQNREEAGTNGRNYVKIGNTNARVKIEVKHRSKYTQDTKYLKTSNSRHKSHVPSSNVESLIRYPTEGEGSISARMDQ